MDDAFFSRRLSLKRLWENAKFMISLNWSDLHDQESFKEVMQLGWGLNVICCGRQHIGSKKWSCEMKYFDFETRLNIPLVLSHIVGHFALKWSQNEELVALIDAFVRCRSLSQKSKLHPRCIHQLSLLVFKIPKDVKWTRDRSCGIVWGFSNL